MKTDIETLRMADWDSIEREVVARIRFLKAAVTKLDANMLNDKIANDLFLPALALLGDFCTRFEIDEGGDESVAAPAVCAEAGRNGNKR